MQSISAAVMSKQILDLLPLEIIFNLSTLCLLYAQVPDTLPAIGTSTQLMVWFRTLVIFYYSPFASFFCFRNRFILTPDVVKAA